MTKKYYNIIDNIALALCCLMYFGPVHESAGAFLIIATGLLAYFSPSTGLLLLAASTDVPDPVGTTITSTQLATLVLFIVFVLKNNTLASIRRKVFWTVVTYSSLLSFPIVISGIITSQFDFALSILKLIPFLFIAHFYLDVIRNRYVDGIWALSKGFLVPASVFWLKLFGLPTADSVELWRGSMIRLSSQDPNVTALSLGIGLVLCLTTAISFPHIFRSATSRYLSVLIGTLAGLPGLIYTGSRAALVAFTFSMAIFAVFHLTKTASNQRFLRHSSLAKLYLPLSALVVAVIFPFIVDINNVTTSLGNIDMLDRSFEVKLLLWSDAIYFADTHLLFGVGSQAVFRSSSHFGNDIHNTYLEYLVLSGILSFLLFLLVISSPVYHIYRVIRAQPSYAYRRISLTVVCAFAFTLSSILFISVPANKAFWLSWLAVVYVAHSTTIRSYTD